MIFASQTSVSSPCRGGQYSQSRVQFCCDFEQSELGATLVSKVRADCTREELRGAKGLLGAILSSGCQSPLRSVQFLLTVVDVNHLSFWSVWRQWEWKNCRTVRLWGWDQQKNHALSGTTPTEKKTYVRRKAALRTGSSGAKNVRASGMLIVEAMKCNQPPQPLHNTHMHESNEGFTMSDSGKVHKGPWTPGSGDLRRNGKLVGWRSTANN